MKRSIVLCLTHRVDRDGQHGRLEGRFLVQVEAADAAYPWPRNPRAGEVIDGFFLQDLLTPAFYLRDDAQKSPWVYPEVLQYCRKLPVGYETALAMVRTLAKVQRGLVRMRDADGYLDDYVEVIYRLAQIFDAKVILATKSADGLTLSAFHVVTPEALQRQINAWQRS